MRRTGHRDVHHGPDRAAHRRADSDAHARAGGAEAQRRLQSELPGHLHPTAPPDLNCYSPVIAGRKHFTVLPPDPHHFDPDKNGVGCESRR